MRDLVETLLGPLLGYILAALVRYLKKYRFWRRVEASAKNKLDDERDPINDPTQAAEVALLEEQAPQVVRVARTVSRQSTPPSISRTTSSDIPREKLPRNGSHSDGDRDPGKSG